MYMWAQSTSWLHGQNSCQPWALLLTSHLAGPGLWQAAARRSRGSCRLEVEARESSGISSGAR